MTDGYSVLECFTDVATARDACLKTRPSRDSLSATWSKALPSEISRRHPFIPVGRILTDSCTVLNIKNDELVEYVLPKLYIKVVYCVSCAIHSHVVRVNSFPFNSVLSVP